MAPSSMAPEGAGSNYPPHRARPCGFQGAATVGDRGPRGRDVIDDADEGIGGHPIACFEGASDIVQTALPIELGLLLCRPRSFDQMRHQWFVQYLCKPLGDAETLIVSALAPPGRMQRNRHQCIDLVEIVAQFIAHAIADESGEATFSGELDGVHEVRCDVVEPGPGQDSLRIG